jgi:hypothetical protein
MSVLLLSLGSIAVRPGRAEYGSRASWRAASGAALEPLWLPFDAEPDAGRRELEAGALGRALQLDHDSVLILHGRQTHHRGFLRKAGAGRAGTTSLSAGRSGRDRSGPPDGSESGGGPQRDHPDRLGY